jgi:hypothetical protein
MARHAVGEVGVGEVVRLFLIVIAGLDPAIHLL